MNFKNTSDKFGLISKLLHWSVAILIIGLIGLGWWMVTLDYYHEWYYRSLELHKSFGILVLELGLIKIAWSVYSRAPEMVATLKRWERIGAHIMHVVLFSLMVLIPVTGYLISTSDGQAVSFFGWHQVPAVVSENETLRDLAIEAHYYLAYLTIALIVLHAGAALKHHFWDKDATLKKML